MAIFRTRSTSMAALACSAKTTTQRQKCHECSASFSARRLLVLIVWRKISFSLSHSTMNSTWRARRVAVIGLMRIWIRGEKKGQTQGANRHRRNPRTCLSARFAQFRAMRFFTPLTLALALPLVAAAAPNYPAAPRGDQVDDYFGTKVADPYRWMEDIDSARTQAWIAAEHDFAAAALTQMPERAVVRARLTELWNYPRFGLPFKRGGHYFFTKNDGLQNQAVLYVQETLASVPRVLIDPNTLSTDGTVALTETSPSPDGLWLRYGLASAGWDWNEFHVRSLATGKDTADVIRWVKFSELSWTKDAKGFFYGRYPEPAAGVGAVFSKLVDRRLYYHRLGTAQTEDTLVFALPDNPEWSFNSRVTEDGRYLEISVHQNGRTQNALYYIDLRDPQAPVIDGAVVKLLDAFDANYAVVGSRGAAFFVNTNKGAPRGKIIAIDLASPTAGAWRTLVAESPDSIDSVDFIGGRFVVTYMHDAQSRVAVFGADGVPHGEIALPGVGSGRGGGGGAGGRG